MRLNRLRVTGYGLKVFVFVFAFLFASCSTTKNLPEDEVLYTGISEISYDQKALGIHKKEAKKKNKAKQDSVGVITSMANAYATMEEVVKGQINVSEALKEMSKAEEKRLTPEQEDSVKEAEIVLSDATDVMKNEVEAALAYAPNNGLLGSSTVRFPLQFGLWAYNSFVNDTTKFGKWMFNTFSATPKYITSVNPQLRVQVAQNTLRNQGFFRGYVDYEIQPDPKNERKAKIAYSVYPKELFRLGTIEYQNFIGPADSLIRKSQSATLLHTGDAFSASKLDAERTRLSTLFQNQGHYFFKPEYITFRADTIQDPLKVHLQVRPKADMPDQAKNQYFIGKTRITIIDPTNYEWGDSISHGPYSMRWTGDSKKSPVRPSAIHHYLFYQPGSLYRKRMQERVQEKLAAMGIFSNVQMEYTPRDTTANCDSLDIDLIVVLDKPWDGEFEAKITNKSNSMLGPGLGFGLTKRNAFRGAETVHFKIFGSYEWQTGVHDSEGDRTLLNSFELGTSLDLTYPRIKFFGLTKKMNQRAEGKTTYKINVDWMNRAKYFQMLTVSGSLTYNYQNKRNIKHEFSPFTLNYSNLLYRSHEFDSIMACNPSLYTSMREQFVPAMAYTITYMPGKGRKKENAIIFSVKESGNLISGIYAAAGSDWNEKDKTLLGLPFAQFLKGSLEWRQRFELTRRSCIACRAFAGAVWSYGNSTTAPYSDLFSVGGANSIRAFAARSIGPGCYHPAQSNWSYVDQVGDLKFEANVEYRFPMVASLYGAVFLDAGNVWLMKEDPARPGSAIGKDFAEQIALGTGFGFRYDLDFLVIRFDIGVGLHCPYDTGKSSYYNIPNFWKSLGFHLAVGYPF